MIAEPQPQTPAVRDASSALTYPLAAIQFLTRMPTPSLSWHDDTLSRALLWFPVVGLALGAAAGALHRLLAAHLGPTLAAALTVAGLAVITGGLHEDALADCADAFGSHHSIERTLAILRDSHIGAYGGLALALSLLLRTFALAAVPHAQCLATLATALMLSRASILPLTLLSAASPAAGQGRQIARRTSRPTIVAGLTFAIAITILLLRWRGLIAVITAALITGLSARFYQRRLGGVTGDCFGATVQLVEIAVLLVGAWA